MHLKTILYTLLAIILLPIMQAHAHPGGGSGFMSGFMHPLFGISHILLMFCVGIISSQVGGRAMWGMVAAVIIMVAIGIMMGIAGAKLPFSGYISSFAIIAVGATIMLSRNIPYILAVMVVGIFALYHGNSHGMILAASGRAFLFVLGFLLGTAVLQAAGIIIGMAIRSMKGGPAMLCYIGAIITGIGLEKLFGF